MSEAIAGGTDIGRDRARGVVFDGPVSPTWMERIRGRWTGQGSLTHWSLVARATRSGDRSPRFLVRVDDFPRWDRGTEGFLRFHEILRAAGIRYLLGVIPRPVADPEDPVSAAREWTPEERVALAAAASDVEIAVHGLSHRAGRGAPRSEIVGLPADELDRAVDDGIRALERLGHVPVAYIPPYNAVDPDALARLARRFDVVCGGPESVRWLGRLPGPCRVAGTWFLPSYPPAYGRAADVARFVRRVRERSAPLLIPLTLHWAWEEADGFEGVRALADAVAGATATLAAWRRGAAWTA
jgi:hypothetical protein